MPFTQIYTVAIDRTKCSSASLSNFPVRVSASIASLKSTGNGGDVTSASGFDIVILADDGTLSTYLPWEVDFWDPVNGLLEIWAKIPTVNGSGSGANTTFIVAWGNSAITTQQNTGGFSPANVWDSNFKMVLHLSDGTSLNLNDSTANANNATNVGSSVATAAFIDGGVNTPSGGHLATGTSGFPSGASPMTMSCWFNCSLSGGVKVAMALGNGTTTGNGVGLTQIAGAVGGGRSGGPGINNGGLATAFHLVVLTYDGTQMRVYSDGVELVGSPATTVFSITSGICIIGSDFPGNDLVGNVDEARVSDIARSGDWNFTEHASQRSPGNIGAPDFLIWSAGATVITNAQPQMFVMT